MHLELGYSACSLISGFNDGAEILTLCEKLLWLYVVRYHVTRIKSEIIKAQKARKILNSRKAEWAIQLSSFLSFSGYISYNAIRQIVYRFEFELSLSLKLYYQNKQTIITEYTIVTILVKGDHKIAKVLIVCGSLCAQL